MHNPFFTAQEESERVLVVGCGGFDVVSGIPIHAWLKSRGKQVFLANLSFSMVEMACRERIGPTGWLVDTKCSHVNVSRA